MDVLKGIMRNVNDHSAKTLHGSQETCLVLQKLQYNNHEACALKSGAENTVITP